MARKNQNPEYLALRREYVKLAKRADQRLVRIEQQSEKPMYKGVKYYAYRWAQKNLKAWSGEKDTPLRFNANIPTNQRSLKKKLQIVKQFLDMPTSTKTGIQKTFKKKAEEFNKLHGTNFTWQQLSIFYNSGLAAIKAANTQTLVLTGRKTIQKEIQNFLKEHGTELLEIL